jgi:hypothetical protein
MISLYRLTRGYHDITIQTDHTHYTDLYSHVQVSSLMKVTMQVSGDVMLCWYYLYCDMCVHINSINYHSHDVMLLPLL